MASVSQDWTSTPSTALDTDYLLSQMSNYAQIPTSFYPQPQQTFPHESPPISETSQKDDSDVSSENENEHEDSHHKRKKAGSGVQTDAGKKGKTTAKGKKEPAVKKETEPKDESKLSKRKEQNRAAQRAFRERKEKHVKDLEDKVGQLENKVEPLQKENETLKELLARLQRENVELKQAAFTFSLPKPELSPPTSTRDSRSPPTIFKDAPKAANSPESFVSGSSTSRSGNSHSNSNSNSTSSSHESESSLPSNSGNYGLQGFAASVESPPVVFSSEGFNAFSSAQGGPIVGTGVGAGATTCGSQHRPPQQTRDSSDSADSNPLRAYNQPSFSVSSQASYPYSASSYTNQISTQSPQQPSQQTLPPFEAPSPSSFAFSPSDFFPTSSSAEAGPSSSSTPYQTIASNPSFTSFRDPSATSFNDHFLDSMPSTGFDFDDPSLFNGSLGQFNFDSDPSLAPFVTSSSLLSPPPTTDALAGPASPFSNWLAAATADSATAVSAASDATSTAPEDLATKYTTLYQKANDQKLPWWDEQTLRASTTCGTSQIMLGADPAKKNLQIAEVWEKIQQLPYSSFLDDSALDSLCQEMKSKARCNGSGAVMDPDEVQDLLDELPHRFCKKEAQ